jgi:fucose 4-O-acetylase-like acetyltransferase
MAAGARRRDVDWLRIGATLLLFPFHAARPFDHPPWHLKSVNASEVFDVWVWFVHQFHMPLFFLLAGWSLAGSLHGRDLAGVRRERVVRLLVPFVVGVVLLSPPQAYVEAITQRGFAGSFLDFLPHFFTSLRWFSWHHLWFLIYLFTFSMLYLRPLATVPALGPVRPWHLWAAVAPLAVVQVGLRWRWPGYQNLYDDWANFAWYSLIFVGGFLVARAHHAEATVRDERRRATVVFVLAILVMLALLDALRERVTEPGAAYALYWSLSAIATVSALIALLGHATRLADVDAPSLRYFGEAALPLYVLHQTVIVGLGYWLVDIPVPLGVRYALLLGTSFVATLAAYHFVVRPSRVLRAAFGMRARAGRRPADTLPAVG